MPVDIKSIAEKNIGNRVARVFVSSTFRDMRAERKYLMESIFPDIKRHCKRLGIEFVPIDLRWGISDAQAQRGETLERIFSSIDESRPFFVCLLGDSYGSRLPSIDNLIFSEDFWDLHSKVEDYILENRSYTDAEIRHGALDLDESSRELVNFHCWLRDEHVKILVDVDEEADDASVNPKPDDSEKLQELKSELDGKWKNECDTYTSVGDQNNATDLYNLVDKEILKWIIRRFLEKNLPSDERDLTWEYAYALHKMPTWLENQDFEQAFFERSRIRGYVHSIERYRILNDFIKASEAGSEHGIIDGTQRSNVLAITGKSGVGKSSLLVNWVQKYIKDHRKDRPDDLILTHYVSASEGSEYPVNILRRFTEKLELELKKAQSSKRQNTDRSPNESKSLEDRKKEFSIAVSDWLSVSERRRLILVVDGLNQLSEEDGNKDLVWLPPLPDRVKLILSTTEDDEKTCDAIGRRGWDHKEIELLNYEQKKGIVNKILEDKSKEDSLTDGQKKRICDANVTENSLVLRVLLDELCYVGNYQNLAGEIDFYLAQEDGKEVSEVGFLKRVLERLEKRLAWLNGQPNVAVSLACLLSASRYGLTEEELEKASGLNQFEVSMFLGALDSHLTNRSGRYSFSHNFIERAVNDKYGSEHIKEARESLITYFLKTFNLFKEHLSDEDYREYLVRSCVEVPYQLRELGEWNRLYEFLLDFDVFDELYDYELTSNFCLYWNELSTLDKEKVENEKKYKFDMYLNLKLDDSLYDVEKKARLWHKLGHITDKYNVYEISEEAYNKSLLMRRTLAKQSPEVYDPDVASTLNNLGNLHQTMGSYSESESELKESLTLFCALANKFPEVYNPYVATTLNNLGNLHRDMGSYSESESELKESLTIRRALAENSPEVYNPDVAATLNNLGNLHRDMGSYSDSEFELKESLTIYRGLAKEFLVVYNPYVAITLNNLGNLHHDMGSYSEADPELKESLTHFHGLAKQSPEVYNPHVAATLNNLGNLHHDMSSYSEAEPELKKSLALYRGLAKEFPEAYNPYIARTLNNLGNLHHDMGSYSESDSELKESLTLYRALAQKSPGGYNSYVAKTLNNLGFLHRDMGSYSESESELAESLAIYRGLAQKSPEVYNPYVATALNILGELHSDMCSYTQAESEYKESLTLYCALAQKSPEVYNPYVTKALNNLGYLHKKMCSYTQAESEYKESLTICRALAEKSPEVYSPYVARTLNNLGNLHRDMGSYSESESEYLESLTLYRVLAQKLPEVYNPYVATTLFNLAAFYLQTERYNLAKEKLLEYVELYQILAEATRHSQAKQFASVQAVLAQFRKIEENQ